MGKNFGRWQSGKNSWRGFYANKGFAKKGQDVHHWLFEKSGNTGSGFSWWAKNQMWNLKPMKTYNGVIVHKAIHGNSSILQVGTLGKAYLRAASSPTWFKATLGSTTLRLAD